MQGPAKLLALLVLGVAALLCRAPARAQSPAMPPPGVAASTPPGVTVDPAVWSLEASAFRAAILTFDHHPSAAEIVSLEAAGLAAAPYRALPMVVVHGTGAQLRGLPGLRGLRSIFLNRDLESTGDNERIACSCAMSPDTSVSPGVMVTLAVFWSNSSRIKLSMAALPSRAGR